MKQFYTKIFFLFSFLLFTLIGNSQFIIVYGKLKIEKGNLDKTQILVKKNGTIIETYNLPKNGKFEFELDINADYLLTFNKEGYVSKSINVNTKVPEDASSSESFQPFQFQVSLFKQLEGIDYVVFNQPVGKIKYSRGLEDFDYDTDYSKTVRRHIQAVEQKMVEKEKEISRAEQDNLAQKAKEDHEAKLAMVRAENEAIKKAEEQRIRLSEEEKARKIAQLKAEAEARKKAELAAKIAEQARKDSLKNAEAEKSRLAAEARATAEAEAKAARLKEIEEEAKRLQQQEDERARAKAFADAARLKEITNEQQRIKQQEEDRIIADAAALAQKLEEIRKEQEHLKAEKEASDKAELEAKEKEIAQLKLLAEKSKKEDEDSARALAQANAEASAKRTAKAKKRKQESEERRKKARAQALSDAISSYKNSNLNSESFPDGKDKKVLNFSNREVTRITMKKNNKVNIYLKAKYNWGGVYFFEEDPQQQVRSISEAYYLTQTK